ncbi:Ig-like domain-containing protein, partial [Buttiauxella gaviniae]|uniref:Ig-like domain-containing protein n=1 Tax=Buttiauxella gaviniae TaxID=82990 RepID=UPI003975D17C
SQQLTTRVTGTVGGDARVHDVVTLTVNGHEFTGTVQPLADGKLGYSIPVNTADLANGQQVHASITTTDYAGNTATATADHTVTPDYVAEATITIDDITTDNVLNHTELNNPTQTITGIVGGDAKVGDVVDLNFNGTHVYGKVEEFGNHQLGYKIDVNSSIFGDNNVILNKDVNFTASVTSHDNAQNEVTVTTDHTVHVDNHAYNGVSINTVAGDNIVSHAESQREVFITGQVSGKDAQVGDDVEVLVQGTTYPGKVLADSNGHLYYKVPVPAGALTEGNTSAQVTVTSHDKVGNEAVATQTHNFSVDLHADATINIHELTAGSVLNHDELATPKQLITGDVGGDARIGDKVSIEINGHFYGGKVIDLGNGNLGYQIPVDSSAFGDNHQKLDSNVKIIANVTSHDAVGNVVTVTTEHSVHIDNHAEAVNTIGTVAGDDTVNAHESRMPTFISGAVTGDAQAGDPVIVHVNNVDYNGVVVKGSDGKLHYEVPLPNGALHEGQNNVTVTITGHDGSGNISTAVDHKTVTVDTQANNTVTINDATSDNILNHTELGHRNQTITGVVGGDAKIGDEVTLEINGHNYRGRVVDMGDGKHTLGYKIPVPSTVFGDNNTILNKDVSVKATLVSHDAAGNEAIAVSEHTIHVDNHAYNGVTINTVAGDNVVNAGESKHETLVTGRITGKDAHIGDAVDVTVGTTTVHGTIFADPQGHLYYEAKIPTGVLIEGKNDATVTVTSFDAAGNKAVASETTHITLDTHADATINIHELTAGPVLNYDELDTPKQLITGEVGGDARIGDKVSIEVNHHFYGGEVIDLGNGHLGYQIPVDSSAFGDNQQQLGGKVTIIASVTSHDAAGNEVTVHTDHTVQLDNHAEAGITINPLTGDGIINNVESQQVNTKLTGTVNGDVHKGDEVLVMVNGHPYEATVQELPHQNGALGYSVDVLTTDLLADPNPDAYIVGYDANGNIQLAQATQNVGIDLQAEATITIDPVTGDNMINGDESDNEFTTVSGTVGGDVKEGDVVHLVINHNELTTVVTKDGNGNLVWSKQVSTHDLMVDNNITATVTGTDNANNTQTAHADDTIVVDLNAVAKITVDSVTPDNALNADELKQGHTLVSGSVDGEMHAGDPLTLTINGKDYHGFVEDQGNGKMGYHISVSTEDLQANPHIHASISVTDQAQNSTVATAEHSVIIDDHADATLTINVVSGDDILNHLDQKHPTTTINGTVGGDVHKGDIVHVWVNGIDYPATVEPQPHLNNALGYSVEVRTDALLANPYIHATVTAHDPHGNSISIYASHEVSRDDGAHATISINTVSGDDWINNVDAHQDHTTITGKVTGDVHIGDTVDLEVNNQHYTGKVVSEGKGHGLGYSIDVSTDDLLSGGDKPILHASVTGYDEAGNTVQATTQHSVGIDTRADAGITISIDNSGDHWVVTGKVSGDVHEGDTITITAGSDTYTTQVYTQTNHDGSTELRYRFDEQTDPNTGVVTHIPREMSNEFIVAHVTGTDLLGNTKTVSDHAFAQGKNDSSVEPPYTDPSNVAHHPHAEITISPIAGNDVINKVESEKGTTTIRGTVEGDVKAGEFVTLHIGDQDIPVKIVDRPNLPGELGYEVEVDTKYLMAHPDISVTVTAHNDSGEKVHFDAQKMVQIDTHATAEIHLDNIAGDNVINIAEAGAGKTTISGRVTGDGVHDGSNVTIMVNGNPVTTQVFTDSKGVMRFSKDISVDDLRHTPTITVSVTGQDDQGNPFTATDDKTITVDTDISAHITIDTVAGDNIINSDESKASTTQITGKVSGDVQPGDHVTLTVNGRTYPDVEVAKDGTYKVDVQTSDLVNGKPIAVQVTGHDEHGNTLVAHATHSITVDTDAHAGIKVNTVSGDNILSAKDLGAGKTEISGTVDGDAAPGDKVTVTLHGVQETADVVVDSLTGKLVYKLEVDTNNLKAELESQNTDKPEIVVTVSGEDDAGNHFSQDVHKGITIDDHANVVLTLDKVAVDNILNIDESNQPTTQISGTVTGDVKDGGTIILTVNGNERPVTLHGDPAHGYTFKLDVSTSDLLTDQTITYKVIGVDGVGNTLTVTDTNTITIDHDVKNEVHIGTVAVDDKVNIAEHSDPTTMITGTVDGDAQDGDVVTLMLDGKPVLGAQYILQGGQKTFAIAVDNSLLKEGDNKIDVTLTGHDTSGNVATSTDTHTITLDTTIDAHITLDPVAANDVINAAAADNVIITGTITTDLDAKPGDKVTVEIDHKTFTGDVKLYSDGHVGYEIAV